jgi:hypothetical protein
MTFQKFGGEYIEGTRVLYVLHHIMGRNLCRDAEKGEKRKRRKNVFDSETTTSSYSEPRGLHLIDLVRTISHPGNFIPAIM